MQIAGLLGATISSGALSDNSGKQARPRLEFGTKAGKPHPGAASPTYSPCHFWEVASRGNDLPSHTGQRLSKERCNLWRRRERHCGGAELQAEHVR